MNTSELETQAPTEVNVGQHLVERVGLDIGFGDIKIVVIRDGTPVRLTFPAVLGQAQTLSNFTVGLNGTARRKATRMVYAGVEYYVGDDALAHSRTLAGRQDRGRIGSTEERVLALAALARLDVNEVYIVTGLPVLWFEDRKKLVRSLQGEHCFTWGKQPRKITIHGVKVLPQPLGGLFSYLLDMTGQARLSEQEMTRTYACLDVGWNTTDLSAIQKLQPVENWLGGSRVGMRNVIQIVGDTISREHGLSLTPHEVEGVIRDQRIAIFGEYHDLSPIIKSATTTLAQQIVSVTTGLWGDGASMDFILVFGGGAATLGSAIREAFPKNSVLLAQPGQANAIGFCYYAQRLNWK